jgi:hypothetical protein
MKTPLNTLLLTALLAMPSYAATYEISPTTPHEEFCYARAMIGLDSVINARLGVPAEHALYLAVLNRAPTTSHATTTYSKSLLNTIWDAYFWRETPHSYAIKVFYRCATEQVALRGDRKDWIVSENY